MCERKCWNTSTTNCEGYGSVWMAEWLSLDLHAVSFSLVFSYSFLGDEAKKYCFSNGHNSQMDGGSTLSSLLCFSEEGTLCAFRQQSRSRHHRKWALCFSEAWQCAFVLEHVWCLRVKDSVCVCVREKGKWCVTVILLLEKGKSKKGDAGERWETARKSKVSP